MDEENEDEDEAKDEDKNEEEGNKEHFLIPMTSSYLCPLHARRTLLPFMLGKVPSCLQQMEAFTETALENRCWEINETSPLPV